MKQIRYTGVIKVEYWKHKLMEKEKQGQKQEKQLLTEVAGT